MASIKDGTRNINKKVSVVAAAALGAVAVVGGCSLTGPTCKAFLDMDPLEQRRAVVDWLVFNDMIDDRASAEAEAQIPVAEEYLERQCRIQVQQDIPTMLNQFRP